MDSIQKPTTFANIDLHPVILFTALKQQPSNHRMWAPGTTQSSPPVQFVSLGAAKPFTVCMPCPPFRLFCRYVYAVDVECGVEQRHHRPWQCGACFAIEMGDQFPALGSVAVVSAGNWPQE